jgi:hypothetical protein
MTGLLTGHFHLKGLKQPQTLFDCEALATLRFKHLGHHFMKPGGFEDISVRKILHFVQGAGMLNE